MTGRALPFETRGADERGDREFAATWGGLSEASRRQLLQAMGACLGLAGLTACSDQPDEQALPYVRTPEMMVPDQARHYATAVVGPGGYAQPVLGVTFAGRPTKLEGLPGHPASQGAADAFTQAAILGLYDPDRSQTPRHLDRPVDWSVLDGVLAENARRLDTVHGRGLRILTGQLTSPTLGRQLDEMMERWPQARWHVLEPVGDDLRRRGAELAFGRPLDQLSQLDRADVVVSLDDDLLGPGAHQTRNARRWGERRRSFQAGGGAHLLFVAEPTPSLTGAMAGRRLACPHARIGALALALARELGAETAPIELTPREAAWVAAAGAALRGSGTRGLLSIGAHHAPEVQALGLQLNGRLGGLGTTLRLIEPAALAPPDGAGSFAALCAAMAAEQVDTLLILDANPVYAAPRDGGFTAALQRVRLTLHAGLHRDETARGCQWHAPIEHDLETWTDARAVDGTVSLIQPLVRPFYAVRSRHAVLEMLQGRPTVGGRDIVAATWRPRFGSAFDGRWAEALRQGWVAGTAAPEIQVAAAAAKLPSTPPAEPGLELVFRPDPCVWDGRYANNPFLQELPKPLTKVTWSNVLAVSPALAAALSLADGDVAEVRAPGGAVQGQVWITPGQAPRTVTAFLGYGRQLPDQVGDAHGYDAYALRTLSAPSAAAGALLTRVAAGRRLAVAQPHQGAEGEVAIRILSSGEVIPKEPPAASFFPDKPAAGPQWGMSVDTDLCIGCNACVTACDAENNIAMVGEEQVALGRVMHWLRIDHYAWGDPQAPTEAFQPVPCMHCQKAPCEMGCPVNATVHGPDGLNLQVYNRCIGTRTCSSYCPYKVRRFNWFDFTGDDPPERRAQRNPNVTVRARGVMEKCTYCIQRVSEARIRAGLEGRPIADGEVRTACQQTCPTDAIVFGDVSDPQSAVSKRKSQPRDYSLLPEENTRPRTTYLARLRAPGEG